MFCPLRTKKVEKYVLHDQIIFQYPTIFSQLDELATSLRTFHVSIFFFLGNPFPLTVFMIIIKTALLHEQSE